MIYAMEDVLMKYIQFTKKENEIMDILWKNNNAMSANDIK